MKKIKKLFVWAARKKEFEIGVACLLMAIISRSLESMLAFLVFSCVGILVIGCYFRIFDVSQKSKKRRRRKSVRLV